MLNGFINVNKPLNMTSSDVVVILRGILRRLTGEKQKVGHLGTLDPMASGVLPIAVGTATRFFDYAQAKTKVYQATFKFGEETDTLDCAGKIVKTSDNVPSKERIIAHISTISGNIAQIPPAYSAKSINGRRAYDLARAGKQVDLPAKTVYIKSVKLIEDDNGTVNLATGVYNLAQNEYAFEIECGSGTYIRAIARDIASALGCVAYMTSLVRIRSGIFDIQSSNTIEELQNTALECLKPLDCMLQQYDKFVLPQQDVDRVLNGVLTKYDDLPTGDFVVMAQDMIVGIAYSQDNYLRIRTRF